MLKKLFFCFIAIMALYGSYAADVDVKTYIYQDSTIFNYVFNFNNNDSISKFAVEKPNDAKLDYIIDKNGKLEYDEAGDYYIIKLEEGNNNTIYLKFTSEQISKEIFETNSYRHYVNFNFNAETLVYEIYFKEDLGELIDIFPPTYQVYNSEKIRWTTTNVKQESLFIINFRDATEAINEPPINYFKTLYFIIPLIILLTALIIIYRKYKQLEKLQQKILNQKPEKQKQESTQKQDEGHKEEEMGETFEEIIKKHLTENEQDIVKLIKEKEGISQYDILNYLPQLTKSNLSKIISKLDSKKILKRIKVGKVNTIYLGEKLSETKKD